MRRTHSMMARTWFAMVLVVSLATGFLTPIVAAQGSPAIEQAGTSDSPASQDAIPDPPGWIAYVDHEGLWIMRPDGSERMQLMAAPPSGMWSDAGKIAWSHDGAMLAFNGPTGLDPANADVRGIWIYREGQAYHLPNTESCAYPAFTADNQRVIYTCWGAILGDPTEAQMAEDPQTGFLSSSALDGSDQRIEISYAGQPPIESWTALNGTLLQVDWVDVNPVDGSVLVTYKGETAQPAGVTSDRGTMVFDASMNLIVHVPETFTEEYQVHSGLFPRFVPGVGIVRWYVCLGVCVNGEQFMTVDLNDNEVVNEVLLHALGTTPHFSLSPDGLSVINWVPESGTGLHSPDISGLSYTGLEQKPAWQPVPVRVSRPVGPPIHLEFESGTWTEETATEEGDPAGETPVEPTATAESPDLPLGDGWVASIAPEGGDLGGAVLLTRPDGSEQVVLTDRLPFYEFQYPSWSSDGTMLAFNGPTFLATDLLPYTGIWVYREGQLTHFPNTEFCINPVFTHGNQRVSYRCAPVGYEDISPADLATDPKLAMIASSALDGTDQRIEVAFTDAAPIGSYLDDTGNPDYLMGLTADFERGSILGVSIEFNDDGEAFTVLVFDNDINLVARGPWCPAGCANGTTTDLVGLDGGPFEYPGIDDLLAWYELPPPRPSDAVQPVPVEILMPGETPPAAAPTEDDSGDAGSGGTLVEEPEATGAATEAPDLDLGPGWIAYTPAVVGAGGVTLVRPDGSERVVLTEMAGANLSWSHDGTMLAFNGPAGRYGQTGPQGGIWLYRDGVLSELPETENCTMPAFTADNLRLLYVCPDDAHAGNPVDVIMPEGSDGVGMLAMYFPLMSYLGTIRSANLDGSDVRIEYEVTPDDLATVWGNPTHDLMVVSLHVRPADGALLVVFADAVYRPSSAGGVLFDAEFGLVQRIILDDRGVIPAMLPDGSILQIAHCPEGGCPDGRNRQLLDIDGNPVDLPLLDASMPAAWTSDLSPDGDAVLNWNYYDGVWIVHEDGSVVTLDAGSSSTAPEWQPVPVEIVLPAA